MKPLGSGIAKIVNIKDLESMAAAGMTPAQIATYYGVTRQGLVKLVENNPELSEAFHNGLDHVLVKCVNVIMSKVENNELFAAIYMLNNRFGWMEAKFIKDKVERNNPTVQIFLPDNGRDSNVIDSQ
jgi:hypothetical protein